MSAFDPAALVAALNGRGVRYVVIGGLAATIHGSPYVTTDLDITPAEDEDNLARLSAALHDLDARVRTEGEADGVVLDHDGASLARSPIWNLVTEHGALDIAFVPAGTSGFTDLDRDAVTLEILGVVVRVASLADVVRSKAAAGRAKDTIQLPLLRRLLEEGAD